MRNFFIVLFMALFVLNSNAQLKQIRFSESITQTGTPGLLEPVKFPLKNRGEKLSFDPSGYKIKTLLKGSAHFKVLARSAEGTPIAIEGKVTNAASVRHLPVLDQAYLHLGALKSIMSIENPETQFILERIDHDEQGNQHVRLNQVWDGIKVYGGEVILHTHDGDIDFVNGRYWIKPVSLPVTAVVNAQDAYDRVVSDMGKPVIYPNSGLGLLLTENATELVYLPVKDGGIRLAYHHTVFKNAIERWEYFTDATDGSILKKYPSICTFHNHKHDISCSNTMSQESQAGDATATSVLLGDGPTSATAQDLFNINRTINTYQVGSKFYLIDGSRPMFHQNSIMPNDPMGSIWTIDAFNTSPQNSNFQYDHVTSNNNSWTGKTSVSAHYNGGRAFEYFKNVFNRNSINGDGGNIISFINIADEDGSSLGNAFWNGLAMFYGNGDGAFQSLARGLDVAGHEMTHGVVQNSANLEYEGESGALNESFADVFGAMIDRDDWLIGEDVVKTAAFPSGALRSLQDPHNGAAFGNFNAGWQPKKFSERFTGPEDNGGVHINSGIPNHAFFLFASNVGKDKAEKVYYKALTNYLTKSSQFVDCRIAVIRAAKEEFGDAAANAAAAAFDAVEVFSGNGGSYEENVEINPGTDMILFTSEDLEKLYIYTPDGQAIADPLTNSNPISKPSISDDGSLIVFVADDQKIHYILIDWAAGQAEEDVIQASGLWRNAAISKDGTKLAALRSVEENVMVVFDLISGSGANFELSNPTFTEGISTADVLYADVMDWDFSGQYVMYDAFNRLESTGGSSIEYWDIGFIKVWNIGGNTFALPDQINKLFPALEEGLSVANPTFSKNSPYIIAMDYFDGFDYAMLGVNLEKAEVGLIAELEDIGYPSFSKADNKIIYDNVGFFSTDLNIIDLDATKIQGKTGTDFTWAEGYSWGVWFSNGIRDITAIREVNQSRSSISVSPNPVADKLTVWCEDAVGNEVTYQVSDLNGRNLLQGRFTQTGKFELVVDQLRPGIYFISLRQGNGSVTTTRFVKL